MRLLIGIELHMTEDEVAAEMTADQVRRYRAAFKLRAEEAKRQIEAAKKG